MQLWNHICFVNVLNKFFDSIFDRFNIQRFLFILKKILINQSMLVINMESHTSLE